MGNQPESSIDPNGLSAQFLQAAQTTMPAFGGELPAVLGRNRPMGMSLSEYYMAIAEGYAFGGAGDFGGGGSPAVAGWNGLSTNMPFGLQAEIDNLLAISQGYDFNIGFRAYYGTPGETNYYADGVHLLSMPNVTVYGFNGKPGSGKADWVSWGQKMHAQFGQSLGWNFEGYGTQGQNGQGSRGWDNSKLALDIAGGIYGALQTTVRPGDQWLGKNGKYYNNSWGGNQYTGGRSGAFKAASTYKWAGRATVSVSALIGVAETVNGYHMDGGQFGYNAQSAAFGTAGSLLGGWAGAEAGASAGAAIGIWFGGVGAVPGAIIGGFVGGFVGGYFGGKIGSGAVNYYNGR